MLYAFVPELKNRLSAVPELEQAHIGQRVLEGATALAPAGIVMGTLTGTEGTKLKVATGEYDRAIDRHIAEIQRTCGVQ